MIYLGIYVAVFIVWMAIELLVAPRGFEDDSGFHYGAPEKQDLSKQ
ncbi:MAG: hypothetical protein NTX22_08415 [Ignavibacteriales bacterium]|nr:hypothetical protein [Ignavibacteriales bacterium]